MKQAATKSSLRRLCPNIDKEDGLETVLEIPIPEEMFSNMGSNVTIRWQNMLTWMKAQTEDKLSSPTVSARLNELRFLLYLVGSPLIPLQVQLGHSIHRPVRDCSIEASTAKYIVQQYIAATGGQPALNAVESMCVTGQIKITASDFHHTSDTCEVKKTSEENGGFVLWQKDPDLWCLELVVSGCKVCCGSNGKVSWRHSSNQQSPIAKGAPRPLRRFLQSSGIVGKVPTKHTLTLKRSGGDDYNRMCQLRTTDIRLMKAIEMNPTLLERRRSVSTLVAQLVLLFLDMVKHQQIIKGNWKKDGRLKSIFGALWPLVSSWIGSSSVTAQVPSEHFVQFTVSAGGLRARRSFMQLIWLACVWVVWTERN
ncbi:hypothetical protein L195_g012700, partial [Trifolium pratense]